MPYMNPIKFTNLWSKQIALRPTLPQVRSFHTLDLPGPHELIVTTRISTCLVGEPYKPLKNATVTRWGVYILIYTGNKSVDMVTIRAPIAVFWKQLLCVLPFLDCVFFRRRFAKYLPWYAHTDAGLWRRCGGSLGWSSPMAKLSLQKWTCVMCLLESRMTWGLVFVDVHVLIPIMLIICGLFWP